MVNLHRWLRSGQSLAASMCHVREEHAGDPYQQAAALSLLALGAG
jgi:hypothetical protein